MVPAMSSRRRAISAVLRPAGKLKDLTFKVPDDFHHSVKLEATKRRMSSMNERRRAAFDHDKDFPASWRS